MYGTKIIFSGISDLNKLFEAIKEYRVCDKKSKFGKLLYGLIKCRRVNLHFCDGKKRH